MKYLYPFNNFTEITSQIQAEMSFLCRVAGLSLRDKVGRSDIVELLLLQV